MPDPVRYPPARKRLGQHFLEPVWASKVVDAIGPRPDDYFIEIGPGRGALTRPLAAQVRQLTAYELDRTLAARLTDERIPGLRVIEGDFLEMPPGQVRPAAAHGGTGTLRAAGNLPYNVASPILFKLSDLFLAGVKLVDASVMLQREVADRLLADPGSKDYGVLTVLIRHTARVERLLNLPPGAFRPPPKVRSSVVRLSFHAPDPPVRSLDVFAAITKAVFTHRRKMLGNALAAYSPATMEQTAAALARTRIDPRRRPETLSLSELAALADALT